MKGSHWIIIGLAAVIVIMLIFDKDPETQDTTVWKNEVAKQTAEIKNLKGELILKQQQIKSDSLQGVKAKEEYEVKVTRLRSTVANLKRNPVVVKVLEENPEVYDLINKQDSLAEVQDNRIMSLETELGKLRVNMVGVTQNFEQQLQAQEERFQASQNLAEDYRKENRKVKRQSKVAKILIPIVGVAGVLLGSSL